MYMATYIHTFRNMHIQSSTPKIAYTGAYANNYFTCIPLRMYLHAHTHIYIYKPKNAYINTTCPICCWTVQSVRICQSRSSQDLSQLIPPASHVEPGQCQTGNANRPTTGSECHTACPVRGKPVCDSGLLLGSTTLSCSSRRKELQVSIRDVKDEKKTAEAFSSQLEGRRSRIAWESY